MLGADTPTETMVDAAAELEPKAIIVAALDAERLDTVAGDLEQLSERHRVFLAGAAASPQLARRAGATVLAGGPVDAADWLTRALTG